MARYDGSEGPVARHRVSEVEHAPRLAVEHGHLSLAVGCLWCHSKMCLLERWRLTGSRCGEPVGEGGGIGVPKGFFVEGLHLVEARVSFGLGVCIWGCGGSLGGRVPFPNYRSERKKRAARLKNRRDNSVVVQLLSRIVES